jgi:fatty-acyl-CoA synthase
MSGTGHGPTYTQVVLNALRRRPDATAFVSGGQEWTYAQTEDRLSRLVALLHERGLRPGQGVGVLSPNRPEVWLGQAGPPLAGGRFTALHPLGSLDDHVYSCDEAELRFLLVDPAYAGRAAELLDKSGAVEAIFTFGPADVGEDLHPLLDAVSARRLDAGLHSASDTAWLLYTGGTTGVPKAAMLSEAAMAQMAYSVSTGWDLPRERRYLACAPISHAAGMLILPTMMAGGTTVLLPSFDPAAWMEAVAAHGATVGLLVPTMIYAVLDHPDLEFADLSSLETVMYGASPMSPTRMIEAMERIGRVFSQLYGQTECAGIATALWRSQHDPARPEVLASAGMPIPGNRVAVLDEEGDELPAGEAGEICVQGPTVMEGYFKQPGLTAETISGGWLRTGDMATVDDEGYITIVDRKKDMIVSGGFNVFPREIEDVVSRDEAVSAVAVIGVPDEKWGEAVKALVVPKPGTTVDAARIIALVREHKGPVYAPKSVDVIDAMPLTAVGKPDKKVLRARYWEGQSRLVN